MRVQELRIGNLFYPINRKGKVYVPNEIPFKIVEITQSSVKAHLFETPLHQVSRYSEFNIIDVSEIPLTEEWLLKFGFSKEHSSVRENEYWSNGATLGLIKISGFYYHDFIAVTSVHQLQNIYFALTGEELTIKEA